MVPAMSDPREGAAAAEHEGLHAAEEKMREAGVAEVAIATFAEQYGQLLGGERGLLPDSELEPEGHVASLEHLDDAGRSADALDKTAVIKLNGGLGTSMGLSRAKSLIEVKDGLSFLDIIALQTLELRKRHDVRLPLVLMDSFSTREDTLGALERYPELAADVPLDFLQNMEPKLRADDLHPVSWPDDPALEWCPPGHGDLYSALQASGMLDELRRQGYEYAFVSNSDNLGAVLDERILGWFADQEIPFLMEVVEGTEADRKGGHIARHSDGRLVLRETVQVPEEDEASFRDFRRWRFYNTNSLWLNLARLAETLEQRDGVLGLPLIVNEKNVDPSDSGSPEIVQLEAAMGAAIGVFEGAQVLQVPRARFAPVKTTSDLLVLRSDAYALDDHARVALAPERDGRAPLVELDSKHYKLLRDFDARFPAGPPSLLRCEQLVVRGDVFFGGGVVVRGRVEIEHSGERPLEIEAGRELEG